MQTILHFNKAGDDEVALASAAPQANHLHFAPDTWTHHSIFTGWRLLLMPN